MPENKCRQYIVGRVDFTGLLYFFAFCTKFYILNYYHPFPNLRVLNSDFRLLTADLTIDLRIKYSKQTSSKMLSVYVKDKSDPSPNVLVGKSRKKGNRNIDTGVKEW